MNDLISLGIYAFLSIGIGALLCILLTWKFKKPRWAGLVALVFFGGPVFLGLWTTYEAQRDERQFKEDVAYVKELCAKYGGDKIYRTVDNVEGVFQIKPKEPVTDAMWRDQYGMPDPWSRVLLESENPAIAVGPKSAEEGADGYWFLEQNIGLREGPPYLRRFSTSRYESGIEVNKLRSRYGYLTEDISTSEMRSRWIAGGRVQIIDLQTKDVLAERTGYFRALGSKYRDAWGGVMGTDHICPKTEHIGSFVRKVLKPTRGLPSQQQINSLKQD